MSDNFQWQTDNEVWEESWEPTPPKPENDPPTQSRQYWPIFMGVAVIGIIMVVWVVYRSANEQIETVTEDRATGVLASLD